MGCGQVFGGVRSGVSEQSSSESGASERVRISQSSARYAPRPKADETKLTVLIQWLAPWRKPHYSMGLTKRRKEYGYGGAVEKLYYLNC